MDKGKRKHKSVSFEDKLVALKRLDNGERIKKVAVDMGVGMQTVADWRKNRDKIHDYCTKAAAAGLSDRKRMRLSDNPELDSSLYLWVTEERKKGTLITGPLLQEKALSMNAMLKGDASFSASAGWLDRFKKRHSIDHLHITHDKHSADSEVGMVHKNELLKLVADGNLSPDQVYNCNEMSVYFKMLPGKALAAFGEDLAFGLKSNEDRITVLACSNASGTHKLPLMIIGESMMTPHSFTYFHNMNVLPVHYRVQKNALMNDFLFKEWFEGEFVPRVETFLQSEKLSNKAVLLTNNAMSHPNDRELLVGNVKGVFLGPPKTTALLQLMDQVVMQNLKCRYLHKFLQMLHKCKGNDDSLQGRLKAINIKSAIDLFAEAWKEIGNCTLVRSWRMLWPEVENIVKEMRHYKHMDKCVEANEHVINCTAVFVNMLNTLPGCDNITEYDVEEWLTGECDEKVSSEEIVNTVLQEAARTGESNQYVADQRDPNQVTHFDATRALEIALSYVQQQDIATSAEFLLLKRWRNYAAVRRPKVLKQTKITSYFMKEC